MATLKLTPTLLLGLGGTGKDVLLRTRRLFFERFGKNPFGSVGYPIVGYLSLDTDSQALDQIAREPIPPFLARNIRLTTEGDVPEMIACDIKPHEFEDYFNGGAMTYPHIFEWMPEEMNKFGSAAVVQGAGQNRLFGRLAFFHHYNKIRAVLKQRLLNIHNYAVRPELVKTWLPEGAEIDSKHIEVVMVYSLAGGTGAGMFLDAAMLVRSLLDELKLATPYITHHLVLPEAITGSGGAIVESALKRKVEENAFAALREMEYFALRREGLFDLSIPPKPSAGERGPGQLPLFEVRWERDKTTRIYSAPWDTCYLIGGSNDPLAGQQLGFTDIYQMIAEQISLYFDPSDFGEQIRRNRVNLIAKNIDVMPQKVFAEDGSELFSRYVSRRFNTFGLAQLLFDRSRMRRAAAHRLANLLVETWWNRSNGLLPNEMAGKAEGDLGTDDPGTVPTVVPDSDNSPLSLGLVPIARQMLVVNTASSETIGDQVTEVYKGFRAAIEEGTDYARSEQDLKAWLQTHKNATRPPEKGERVAATAISGIIRQNRVNLQERAEQRLKELFAYRIREWGIPDTTEMFSACEAILEKRTSRAAEYKNATRDGGMDWQARLLDAKRIPLYVKKAAVRIELLRGVDEVRKQISGAYKVAIGEDIFAFFRGVSGRVRKDNPGASYQASLRTFSAKLKRVTDYLASRFQEFSGPEQTRSDAKGNPVVAKARQGRATALLHRQNEAEYDKKIAVALRTPEADIQRIDWLQLSQSVFAELGRSENRRMSDVPSLADLILRFVPIDGTPVAADADYEDLARELAEACEALLVRFADEVNARDEFFSQSDPDTLLKNLRTYSGPMLRQNQDVAHKIAVDTDPVQMLGMAGQNSPTGLRFVEMLKQAGAQDALSLAGISPSDMKSDSIVLYREKAGIPICYYNGLNELGEAYDSTRRMKELHISYDYMKGKLPEIRHVKQADQIRMAHCLETAVIGIVIRRITYDPGKTTFAMVYADFPRQLGTQLEEVIRNLTDQDRWAESLKGQIDAWLTDAAEVEGGKPMALLWAAMRWFYEQLRARVEGLMETHRGKRPPDHPLLAFVRDRIIPRIRARLARTPSGLSYIKTFEELDRELSDPRTSSEERANIWRHWEKKVAADLGQFTPINNDDLPIPVLVDPAGSRSFR